ncbi:MAG: GNAT family N-acetyltransferase [Gammaproteobacteria bacterium]|nr:MAG: GNAT family N-acetyltransferase [Gammaproteobacteria bacterium]
MIDFEIRIADWKVDREAIRNVRETVFVREQSVDPELEWDGLDAECVHAIAENRNRDVVGTGRLQLSGKIGRMAVLQPWRKLGVGTAILERLVESARETGIDEVFLHSQKAAIAFYARHGFVCEGDEFQEAGIPHRLMKRGLR